MTKFILVALVCICVRLEAQHGEEESIRPQIHNEKRYEDLLGDPFTKRFLSIMLDPRSYGGPSGYAVLNNNEFIWCREQGADAFPILLEVLKREPNPGKEDSGEIWNSLIYKRAVLNWVRDFPEGDPQPFVEEVRRQLPVWTERQIANHDTHTGFIREALDLLAREGDESDIPLIESFLEDVNRNNKHNAQMSLTKLKERLASEPERKSRPPREHRFDDRSEHKPTSVSNRGIQSHEENADEKNSNLQWIIAGALLVGIVLLLLKTLKGKST